MQAVTTRFAPSPTGWLHLGHALAALVAWEEARKEAGGRFLVRIEDIDSARSRPEYETALFEDLEWLGLEWEQPVRRQSEHLFDYELALIKMTGRGLLYPCFCTRREIQEELARVNQAPHGPDGPLYPGTCRALAPAEAHDRMLSGEPFATRLNMAEAVRQVGDLTWRDRGHGVIKARPERFGDVVLARKEVPTSYHLAVVVDDAAQGVTLVTRGEDLLEATHVHRLLQALLGLPVPEWRHHRLVLDEKGRRLAKRDDARSLRYLREQGWSPARVREVLQLKS